MLWGLGSCLKAQTKDCGPARPCDPYSMCVWASTFVMFPSNIVHSFINVWNVVNIVLYRNLPQYSMYNVPLSLQSDLPLI